MKFRACAAIVALLVAMGCGEDSTVEVINQEPSIAFTFTPIGVPAGFPVDLTVAVSDPNEDDNLTVRWEITRGTLTSQNASNTVMTWAVPIDLGVDTVRVSVSDGEATVEVVEEIKVGTLTTGLNQYIAASSPYILRADGTPPRTTIGGLAAIEAGVEILVDLRETTIDATAGTLNINGTEANPVVIRANDRTLFCGDNRGWWAGILVGTDVDDGVLNMNWGEVWYAVNGVRLRDGASANITNSTIQCCGTNGILHEGTGALVVTDSRILNTASTGITVQALTLLASEVTITGCDISINENTGIVLDINDPLGDVPITITNNRISNNFSHGIVMENWVWPMIEYNNFSFNGGGVSHIRLQSPFHDFSAPDTISVSCNFWGRSYSSSGSIDNTIRDRLDTAGLGTRLDVTPWLNADPYQANPLPPCDGGTR